VPRRDGSIGNASSKRPRLKGKVGSNSGMRLVPVPILEKISAAVTRGFARRDVG
jgi:hypothetical protein